MQKYVKVPGRFVAVEQITHAVVFPDQVRIYPVDYHEMVLMGEDARRMTEALIEAGFAGEGTLINPRRVSVIEDAGSIYKVFLAGADKIVFIPIATGDTLMFASTYGTADPHESVDPHGSTDPHATTVAQFVNSQSEFPAQETETAAVPVGKPRRKKASE